VSALDFLDEELAQLEALHRRRVPRVIAGAQGARVVLDGREVVSFSSNDYLGLAAHPAVAAAARAATERFGVGAGASRLIVGNTEAHEQLERVAAQWLGRPAARLFNSGFAANTGILPVLAGQADQIFSDSLNHASLIDGARLAKASVAVFAHGNLSDLEEMLTRSTARRRIIVTESVFSMDGDVAPLAELRALADRHGAILVVDEAHAVGVFGARGGGVLERDGVVADAAIATLGKGVGVYGAVVAGPRALAEILWNRARPLVFTTGLPPLVCAAATAAIDLIQTDEGARLRSAVWSRIGQLVSGLHDLGIPAAADSPIVPLIVGGDVDVMAWTSRLLERGIYVQGVRPPTVPEGSARLRVTVSAAHSESDIQQLLDALRSGLAAGAKFHVKHDDR
jgi:8-amino-7-oxononanoate synthase